MHPFSLVCQIIQELDLWSDQSKCNPPPHKSNNNKFTAMCETWWRLYHGLGTAFSPGESLSKHTANAVKAYACLCNSDKVLHKHRSG